MFCTEVVRFPCLRFFIEPLPAPLLGMDLEPRRVPQIIEKSEQRCTALALDMALGHQLVAWTLPMRDIADVGPGAIKS